MVRQNWMGPPLRTYGDASACRQERPAAASTSLAKWSGRLWLSALRCKPSILWYGTCAASLITRAYRSCDRDSCTTAPQSHGVLKYRAWRKDTILNYNFLNPNCPQMTPFIEKIGSVALSFCAHISVDRSEIEKIFSSDRMGHCVFNYPQKAVIGNPCENNS